MPSQQERTGGLRSRGRQAGLEARKDRRPSNQETLQIVVEIVGDLVHQVYSPAAHDVVL